MNWSCRILVLVLIALTNSLFAMDLGLPRYFSDHMVLQREKPVKVRGWASPGAEVKVTFSGQEKSIKADDKGLWEVTLESMPANAQSAELTVKSGNDSVVFKDVVVGDVILFARQTSIDIALGRDETGKKAAESYTSNPKYRSIIINTVPAAKPQKDLDEKATNGWQEVDKNSALKMSAAAFYLGKDLSSESEVPVGMIDVNMGRYFPMAWLSKETLLVPVPGSGGVVGRVGRMEAMYEAFTTGKPYGKGRKAKEIKNNPLLEPLYPAAGYNAVVFPLKGISLKGIIMQLGNDYPYIFYKDLQADGKNTDRVALNQAYVKTYDLRKEGFRMEPAMINRIPMDWRTVLGDENLPIAFVTPPSSELWTYAIHNCEMREIQRLLSEDQKGIDLILPGMDSVPFSGQPQDEKLIAERSKYWVLGKLQKKNDTPATGPVFDRFEAKENKATIYFKSGTATGLKAAAGALDYFEVANVDSVYKPAKAEIDGETIKLSCDDISRIFYIRYNYNERPDESLTNAAGLPAIPFRTEKAGHRWLVRNKEDDLPIEYSTPANTWKSGAVTLVNGQLKRIGYPHFSGWLGPIGIKTGPFGPNMGVQEVMSGSPAYGKIFKGDVIYSANGKLLGDDEEMTMASAITESEAKDGKMVLGVHREGKNLNIELQLKPMGRYSATSPWDCLKTEKIVDNLESNLAQRGAPAGFLHGDAIFLLAAGSPEYQWLVRKTAMGTKASAGNNWALGYSTQYLSEYYLATGDKSVLPTIQKQCDLIRDMQIREDSRRNGGWYGRGVKPRGYPAMVHAGISAMLGLALARETGVNVDEETWKRGLAYLERKGTPMGQSIYGDAFRDAPKLIDPEKLLAGKLSTENGKLAEAAVFYDIIGDKRSAYINSNISTHAWYSTYGGHGGHYWDQYWTPLGAAVHSKDAYTYFMKNHRWFRECNRMFDGRLITGSKKNIASTGLALVVPNRRLRILGAPKSPFSPGAPEALKPALDAYYAHDYQKAESLANGLIKEKKVTKNEIPTAEKLAKEAKLMQESISSDLKSIQSLVKEGQLYKAGLILKYLTPILPEGDKRLATAQEQIKNGKARENDKDLYVAALKGAGSGAEDKKAPKDSTALAKMEAEKKAAAEAAARNAGTWECLTPKEFIPKRKNSKPQLEEKPVDQASKWRFKVFESRKNAPKGWMNPGFDDSSWTQTTLPISWPLNHTTLFRTTFTVKDTKAYDLLKFKSWLFRQQNVEIYLNGTLIGRVNNLEKKTGTIEEVFKKSALELLKDGENTLAVATRQNWRWGMLSMRVYNNGFDFMLFARMKEEKADN